METGTKPPRRFQEPEFNALAEFSRPHQAGPQIHLNFRTLFASVLLAVGVGLCIWLALLIHRAVVRPEELGLLKLISSASPEHLKMTIPSGTVNLPPAAMATVGYITLILLLAIACKVAVSLIRIGAFLLRHKDPTSPDGDSPESAAGRPI